MDKNNLISHVLEEIGLTKSEIAVYVALLELGLSSSGKIVDKSKTTSSKIYEVLERLMQKGLVSFIIKGGVKHFEAASPERLGDYIEDKRQRIEKQSNNLKSILPELKMKQQIAKNVSEATIYKGIKGLEAAYNEILANSSGVAEFTAWNIPKRTGLVHNFFKKWHLRCEEKGIRRRLIVNADAKADVDAANNYTNADVKYHPQTTSASINLVGDYTVIFPAESSEITLFVIHDAQTANSFRVEFERLWDQRITTYEGMDQIKQLFREKLEFGDYCALSEGMKIVDYLGEDFFTWWQGEKKKRGVKGKVIIGEEYRHTVTVEKSVSEFRFISGFQNPGMTEIFKDKVIVTNFTENPVAFLIEDEHVAQNHQTYFDLMWNQDVSIAKGEESVISEFNTMLSELEKGEGYTVQGAGFGRNASREMYNRIFSHVHNNRQMQGKKARLLFEQGSESVVKKNHKMMPGTDVRYLSHRSEIPVPIFTTTKKARIVVQGEEPVMVTIDNKDIVRAMRENFDMLWEQEVKTHRGLDAVERFFDEMLDAGHCDLIGARGYFMDARPAWIKKWVKRAEKSGFTMRNIVDPDVKGHYITTLPFIETKYTLQKGFVDLSVYWIYGGKVIMTNWDGDEPILIEMNIPRIVDVYKKQFEMLWRVK